VPGKIHSRSGSSEAFVDNAELRINDVMQSLFLCGEEGFRKKSSAVVSNGTCGLSNLSTPHNLDVLWIDPNHRLKEDVMLTKLFKSPECVRELREGRGGPLLEGFAQKLCQTGYAESSARAHIRAAEHFIYWTDRKAIAVATLNDSVIDGFGRHLHRCRSPRYGHTRQINLQNGA